MNEAIDILKDQLSQLDAQEPPENIEERATLIGRRNELDSAIRLLEMCGRFGIVPGSIVKPLPATEDPHFQYVVASMNESSNSSFWEEVLFDGEQFWLDGGDLVVKR